MPTTGYKLTRAPVLQADTDATDDHLWVEHTDTKTGELFYEHPRHGRRSELPDAARAGGRHHIRVGAAGSGGEGACGAVAGGAVGHVSDPARLLRAAPTPLVQRGSGDGAARTFHVRLVRAPATALSAAAGGGRSFQISASTTLAQLRAAVDAAHADGEPCFAPPLPPPEFPGHGAAVAASLPPKLLFRSADHGEISVQREASIRVLDVLPHQRCLEPIAAGKITPAVSVMPSAAASTNKNNNDDLDAVDTEVDPPAAAAAGSQDESEFPASLLAALRAVWTASGSLGVIPVSHQFVTNSRSSAGGAGCRLLLPLVNVTVDTNLDAALAHTDSGSPSVVAADTQKDEAPSAKDNMVDVIVEGTGRGAAFSFELVVDSGRTVDFVRTELQSALTEARPTDLVGLLETDVDHDAGGDALFRHTSGRIVEASEEGGLDALSVLHFLYSRGSRIDSPGSPGTVAAARPRYTIRLHSKIALERVRMVESKIAELCHAATRGDVATINRMLEDRLDIATKDASGSSACHAAAAAHQLEALRVLIAAQPDRSLIARDGDGRTVLHAAAAARFLDGVRAILELGGARTASFVNARDGGGRTALFCAVASVRHRRVVASGGAGAAGDTAAGGEAEGSSKAVVAELVRELVSVGASPWIPDFTGCAPADALAAACTPLADAALSCDGALVRDLLAGAPPSSVVAADSLGISAVGWVSRSRHSDAPAVLRMLLLAAAGMTDDGDEATVALTAATMASVVDGSGVTPLHAAAAAGAHRIVAMLVASGADVDCRDAAGVTPLGATLKRSLDQSLLCGPLPADDGLTEPEARAIVVRQLAAAGANLEAPLEGHREDDKRSIRSALAELCPSLDEAAAASNADLIRRLCGLSGADEIPPPLRSRQVDMGGPADCHGITLRSPLHEAAAIGSTEAIRALLEALAAHDSAAAETSTASGVNVRDSSGATPLHNAAASGSVDAVAELLAAGAEKDARDGRGRTPLHVALLRQRSETAAHLLRGGAAADVLDTEKMSAVHLAAAARDIDVLKEAISAAQTRPTLSAPGASRTGVANLQSQVAEAPGVQAVRQRDAQRQRQTTERREGDVSTVGLVAVAARSPECLAAWLAAVDGFEFTGEAHDVFGRDTTPAGQQRLLLAALRLGDCEERHNIVSILSELPNLYAASPVERELLDGLSNVERGRLSPLLDSDIEVRVCHLVAALGDKNVVSTAAQLNGDTGPGAWKQAAVAVAAQRHNAPGIVEAFVESGYAPTVSGPLSALHAALITPEPKLDDVTSILNVAGDEVATSVAGVEAMGMVLSDVTRLRHVQLRLSEESQPRSALWAAVAGAANVDVVDALLAATPASTFGTDAIADLIAAGIAWMPSGLPQPAVLSFETRIARNDAVLTSIIAWASEGSADSRPSSQRDDSGLSAEIVDRWSAVFTSAAVTGHSNTAEALLHDAPVDWVAALLQPRHRRRLAAVVGACVADHYHGFLRTALDAAGGEEDAGLFFHVLSQLQDPDTGLLLPQFQEAQSGDVWAAAEPIVTTSSAPWPKQFQREHGILAHVSACRSALGCALLLVLGHPAPFDPDRDDGDTTPGCIFFDATVRRVLAVANHAKLRSAGGHTQARCHCAERQGPPPAPDRECPAGYTALHEAARRGDRLVARMILSLGFSARNRDAWGRCPADVALSVGDLTTAHLLAGEGVPVISPEIYRLDGSAPFGGPELPAAEVARLMVASPPATSALMRLSNAATSDAFSVCEATKLFARLAGDAAHVLNAETMLNGAFSHPEMVLQLLRISPRRLATRNYIMAAVAARIEAAVAILVSGDDASVACSSGGSTRSLEDESGDLSPHLAYGASHKLHARLVSNWQPALLRAIAASSACAQMWSVTLAIVRALMDDPQRASTHALAASSVEGGAWERLWTTIARRLIDDCARHPSGMHVLLGPDGQRELTMKLFSPTFGVSLLRPAVSLAGHGDGGAAAPEEDSVSTNCCRSSVEDSSGLLKRSLAASTGCQCVVPLRRSLIVQAAWLGASKLLPELLELVPDPGSVVGEALVSACRKGHVGAIEMLVDAGAPVSDETVVTAIPKVRGPRAGDCIRRLLSAHTPDDPKRVVAAAVRGASDGVAAVVLEQLAGSLDPPTIVGLLLDASARGLDAVVSDLLLRGAASTWKADVDGTQRELCAARGCSAVMCRSHFPAVVAGAFGHWKLGNLLADKLPSPHYDDGEDEALYQPASWFSETLRLHEAGEHVAPGARDPELRSSLAKSPLGAAPGQVIVAAARAGCPCAAQAVLSVLPRLSTVPFLAAVARAGATEVTRMLLERAADEPGSEALKLDALVGAAESEAPHSETCAVLLAQSLRAALSTSLDGDTGQQNGGPEAQALHAALCCAARTGKSTLIKTLVTAHGAGWMLVEELERGEGEVPVSPLAVAAAVGRFHDLPEECRDRDSVMHAGNVLTSLGIECTPGWLRRVLLLGGDETVTHGAAAAAGGGGGGGRFARHETAIPALTEPGGMWAANVFRVARFSGGISADTAVAAACAAAEDDAVDVVSELCRSLPWLTSGLDTRARSLLHHAARGGALRVTAAIISGDIGVDLATALNATDAHGRTPVETALGCGHDDVAAALLRGGARPTSSSAELAAQTGCFEAAKAIADLCRGMPRLPRPSPTSVDSAATAALMGHIDAASALAVLSTDEVAGGAGAAAGGPAAMSSNNNSDSEEEAPPVVVDETWMGTPTGVAELASWIPSLSSAGLALKTSGKLGGIAAATLTSMPSLASLGEIGRGAAAATLLSSLDDSTSLWGRREGVHQLPGVDCAAVTVRVVDSRESMAAAVTEAKEWLRGAAEGAAPHPASVSTETASSLAALLSGAGGDSVRIPPAVQHTLWALASLSVPRGGDPADTDRPGALVAAVLDHIAHAGGRGGGAFPISHQPEETAQGGAATTRGDLLCTCLDIVCAVREVDIAVVDGTDVPAAALVDGTLSITIAVAGSSWEMSDVQALVRKRCGAAYHGDEALARATQAAIDAAADEEAGDDAGVPHVTIDGGGAAVAV